jgi:phospholipid-transporting ATPase
MIAIIQSIKIISPLNPSSAVVPLVFVLGLSMLREGNPHLFNFIGFEDFARHRSDDEVNATPAYLHRHCKDKTKYL